MKGYKLTHKVNIENIPDEYKFMVKPEMTNAEVGQLGMVVLRQKISNIKSKMMSWYYARRTKR